GSELARDLPLANARVGALGPYPAAMEIAGIGTDTNSAEMRFVPDVDGEPPPHLRTAPTARTPRLVAIASRIDEVVTGAGDFDPSRPAAGLLEMALADACRRRAARTLRITPLTVDADCRRQRVKRAVQGDRFERGDAP